MLSDLSCCLNLIFKHSDTKLDKKKKKGSRFKLRVAARLLHPRLDPPLQRRACLMEYSKMHVINTEILRYMLYTIFNRQANNALISTVNTKFIREQLPLPIQMNLYTNKYHGL